MLRINALRRGSLALLLAIALLGLMQHPADAVDRYWVGNSNFWDVPTSWSFAPGGIGGAGMPQDGDNAFVISSAFNVTVTRDDATPSYTGPGPAFVMLDGSGAAVTTLFQTANRMAADGERVGFNGRGQYNQIGGSNVVTNLWLAGNTGSAGTYTLNGAAASISANFIDVGEANGAGTFNHNNGTVTTSALYVAGFGTPSRGIYTFANGALSASTLALGVEGVGTFVQNGGVASFTHSLEINPGSRYTQNAGSMWVGNVAINGGRFDRAGGTPMTLTPGKSISISGGGTFTQGGFTMPQGSSMLITAGTYSTPNWLDIGNAADGTLTVDGNASRAITGAQSLWGLGTGHASITLSNGAQGTFGPIRLGTFGGAGTFNVFSASTATLSSVEIGMNGGTGVFNANGNVLLAPGAFLTIGSGGAGTVTVGPGGQLACSSSNAILVASGGHLNSPGGFVVPIGPVTVDGGTVDASWLLGPSFSLLVKNAGNFHSTDLFPEGNASINLQSGGVLALDGILQFQPIVPTPSTLTVDGGRFSAASVELIGSASANLVFNAGTVQITGANGLTASAGQPLGRSFDLTSVKSLEVTNTTTIAADGSIALTGGTFSTGSLTGGGTFIFNSGTLKITGSDLVLDNTRPIGTVLNLFESSHAEVIGHATRISLPAGINLFGGTFSSEGGILNAGDIGCALASSHLYGNLTNSPQGGVACFAGGTYTFHNDVVNQPGSGFKGITTHDALTYSGKAATHKQVHPYLRYGILVGSYGAVLPSRLIRHGAHFDFMAVWEDADPNSAEWELLVDVLTDEVRSSRLLQSLLAKGARDKRSFRLLHRPLKLRG